MVKANKAKSACVSGAVRGNIGQISHIDNFCNGKNPDLKADELLADLPFNNVQRYGDLCIHAKRLTYGVLKIQCKDESRCWQPGRLPMTAETDSRVANFIWSICNLLCGPYKGETKGIGLGISRIISNRTLVFHEVTLREFALNAGFGFADWR